KPTPIDVRRMSNISMPDAPSHTDKPLLSSASSAPEVLGSDSDDDLDLDDADFAESEAKYNREKAHLQSKRIDLSVSRFRVTAILQEIMILASLTTEHLPQPPPPDPEVVTEELIPVQPVQPPPESAPTELLTPKAEETDEITVEDKAIEKPLAPATRALRLRREPSPEEEEPSPDLSCLPYYVSAPPTPQSAAENDHQTLPDTLILAMRDKVKKEVDAEVSYSAVLEEYAAAYRKWRLGIRELDEEREEDEDRQQSIEPGLKVTTPDAPSSSAMAAMLEVPPPTAGRRAHSGRWATELDIELVMQESLKTLAEEKKGKKEPELKSFADPEREATVPFALTPEEADRRRFIDTNYQREPGEGHLVYHYEPPEDDFTEFEHKIMVQHYHKDQYAKRWGKLAEVLHKEAGTSRTYKDCINHYYATKWNREYKGKQKRGGRRKGAGVKRGRVAANAERLDAAGEDGLAPQALTGGGRPRRLAAPVFGTDSDPDPLTASNPGRHGSAAGTDTIPEKMTRAKKVAKKKGPREAKSQPLAAAPAASPHRNERKDRLPGVRIEEELPKRLSDEMMETMPSTFFEDQLALQIDPQVQAGLSSGMTERPRSHTNSRPGASSYWSVTEQQDFRSNVAYFGTDWASISIHMGTKTHVMVKNQYQRLVEGGDLELQRLANDADQKRERGEDQGPPPTPTPAQKRRYDNPQAALPRTLAPTPEASELLKSPPGQPPLTLPKNSPPQFTPAGRFSTIAPQAPPPAKPIIPAASVSIQETPLPALPTAAPHQSPPTQPLRVQSQHPHPNLYQQHKQQHPGPRAGFFSNDPPRLENRPQSQSNPAQPARPLTQQLQSHMRIQEQSHLPPFRASTHQERGAPPQLGSHQDHDGHARLAQHSRRVSQENSQSRQFPPTGPNQTSHVMPPMRSGPVVGSPEARSLSLQRPRHPSQNQPIIHSLVETSSQAPSAVGFSQPPASRSMFETQVKEEPRHHSIISVQGTHVQSQAPPPPPPQPQPQPEPQGYPHVSKSSVPPPIQSHSVPPAPKPVAEPRKSNVLALLNPTEPDEPRSKKSTEVPSHTPTPQQQTPIAPPPPSNQHMASRHDMYGEPNMNHGSYSRGSYVPQVSHPQSTSSRQIVDLTSESMHSRPPQRETWQQRQTFHSGPSQAQQSSSHNSPRIALAQPNLGDARIPVNHRSVFAQHNTVRHNPSPPPLARYDQSPHPHSRTPSLNQSAVQQTHQTINSISQAQHAQSLTGTNQILQPNPYAQVDPPGATPQPTGPAGMRPSPLLHVAQQRELETRNEQSRVHNANLGYSNPQTPSEHHSAQPHLRGGIAADPYRGRDSRDVRHDFDARNHERDVSRELSSRGDDLLRTNVPSLPIQGSGSGYQHALQQDRAYRTRTPLSMAENRQSAQRHFSSLPDNYEGYRAPYSAQVHMREGQAPRHPNMYAPPQPDLRQRTPQVQPTPSKDDQFGRDLDARYREDMRRRDSSARMQGQPPPSHGIGPPPPGHEQKQPPQGPADW
ncbi:hypothetical protein P154DRAFT_392314, partial [Amniculicola lignicola CBS 123094]